MLGRDFEQNNSERPVDALAKKVNYSNTDNLKSRDATASKKGPRNAAGIRSSHSSRGRSLAKTKIYSVKIIP